MVQVSCKGSLPVPRSLLGDIPGWRTKWSRVQALPHTYRSPLDKTPRKGRWNLDHQWSRRTRFRTSLGPQSSWLDSAEGRYRFAYAAATTCLAETTPDGHTTPLQKSYKRMPANAAAIDDQVRVRICLVCVVFTCNLLSWVVKYVEEARGKEESYLSMLITPNLVRYRKRGY